MSQQGISLLALTLDLTGTVTGDRFVTPAGAQTGADGNALGVARSSGVLGEKVTVDVIGTTYVESGAAFSKGATLKADASGRGITWVTSGARLAIAQQAATAAGQKVEVLLLPNAA